MTFTAKRRRSAAVAGGLGLALALTACGASSDSTGGGTDVSDADFDCAPYEQFGELDGEEVEVYTGIVAPEDQPFIDSWAPFEECTGMTINYNGSKEFEAQLLVRAQSGNAPDLAFIPQPGLLQSVVRNTGAAVPAPRRSATTSTPTGARTGAPTAASTAPCTAPPWAPTSSPSCGTPPRPSRRPAMRSPRRGTR